MNDYIFQTPGCLSTYLVYFPYTHPSVDLLSILSKDPLVDLLIIFSKDLSSRRLITMLGTDTCNNTKKNSSGLLLE